MVPGRKRKHAQRKNNNHTELPFGANNNIHLSLRFLRLSPGYVNEWKQMSKERWKIIARRETDASTALPPLFILQGLEL